MEKPDKLENNGNANAAAVNNSLLSDDSVNVLQTLATVALITAPSSYDNKIRIIREATNSEEPTMEIGISEDVQMHDEDCPFTLWVKQRAVLLTDAEMQEELVTHYLRKWRTTVRNSAAKTRAINQAKKDLESGDIRNYLDSQRKQFDETKGQELRECKCERARVPIQPIIEALKTTQTQQEVVTTTSGTTSGEAAMAEPTIDIAGLPIKIEATESLASASFHTGGDQMSESEVAEPEITQYRLMPSSEDEGEGRSGSRNNSSDNVGNNARDGNIG